MWTRVEIKDYAKNFLRKNYWKAFVVCLIVALLSGTGSSPNSNVSYNEQSMVSGYGGRAINIVSGGMRSPLFLFTGGTILLVTVVLLILFVTVGFAVEVGQSRFFLNGFKGDVSIGTLFSTFNKEEYWPIVKTMFLRGLYTMLWTLLFIVPGIIKVYEYRFVPYILAEKPELSSREVIAMSREITNGHKMDMFILDFSFMGWYLLGGLLLGLGGFFVNPYREATEARLYNILAGKDDFKDNFENDKPETEVLDEDIFGDDFKYDF